MSPGTFRLNSPTIALFFEEGRQVARTIPQGAVVRAPQDLAADKLIEVVWEGQTILMFAQDIRARGERLDLSRTETHG